MLKAEAVGLVWSTSCFVLVSAELYGCSMNEAGILKEKLNFPTWNLSSFSDVSCKWKAEIESSVIKKKDLMIKVPIKSVVSHLTIAHVPRSTGCVRDRVVLTGFAQRGHRSSYYFQARKQSKFSRPAVKKSRRQDNSPAPSICVFYLTVLSAASEFVMVLYYFLPYFSVCSQ